jgi:acetylornithine/succinyldiaminopimelate/putrescine aminotransferase
MVGIELAAGIPAFAGSEKSPAIEFINRLHRAGLLAIPAGTKVIRLLPALNLKQADAVKGVQIMASVAEEASR